MAKFKEEDEYYGEIEVNGDCFIVKEKEDCSEEEWKTICKMCGLIPEFTERIVFDGVIKFFGIEERLGRIIDNE